EVRGFDYYNTRTGTIESGDTSKIAMWLFDTDYDGRSLYPRHKLRQGQTCRVLIRNWHKLDWETDEQIRKKRSVDKRGAKSDEAYVRDVLGEMAAAQNILVINDEAHHAWRVPPKSRMAGVSKDEINEATKWIGGLDRIHSARGVLTCVDLSATPFAPTGKK